MPGQVRVCISCPFILISVFRHFSFAWVQEVTFTLTKVHKEISSLFPFSLLQSFLLFLYSFLPPFPTPFLINCLPLEDFDRSMTYMYMYSNGYLPEMIKERNRNAQRTDHPARNSKQRPVKGCHFHGVIRLSPYPLILNSHYYFSHL